MPVYVSPGVYIREIDLSLYAPQISTSILGNLGTATKGPVDRPIYISTHTQFIREFGNPHSDHLATLAHLQFLSKGNQSYFTRVTDDTETNAACPINAAEGPASVEGTEQGPFTVIASSPASILGNAGQPYGIVQSGFSKAHGGTTGLLASFQALDGSIPAKYGEFRLNYSTIDGSLQVYDITGLTFDTATSLDDCADIIQAAIRAETGRLETVTYVGLDHFSFEADYNPAPAGAWQIGSLVEFNFATLGGTGDDLTSATYMNVQAGTIVHTPGTDGNDFIMVSTDTGGGHQGVIIKPVSTTANDVCADIMGQTVGLNAWAETVGALTVVYLESITTGATSLLTLEDTGTNCEAYTEVFGLAVPYTSNGVDGTDELIVWCDPFGAYRTGDISNNLANFQGVPGNGSIGINLDGAGAFQVAAIDFSTATSMVDVAATFEYRINLLAPGTTEVRVRYSDGKLYFISADETNLGPGSTVAISAGITGTNLFSPGYVEPGIIAIGSTSQTFTIPAGTHTTDAIVTQLSSAVNFSARNASNYLYLETDDVGPLQVLHIDPTSSAIDVFGFDADFHWGTTSNDPTFTLYAPTPGTDGNHLSAEVSEGYQKTLHEQWLTDNGYSPGDPEEVNSPYYEYREAFKIDLYYDGIRIGSYDNLTVNDNTAASYIETQLGTLASDYDPSRLIVAEDSGTTLTPSYGTYEFGATPATEGSDGNASLLPAHYIGVIAGPTGAPTGLQVYRSAETIDVNLIIVPGVSDTAVQIAMIELCEFRADCMCILDPPFGLSGPQTVVQWSNKQGSYGPGQAINSSYAAIYWPWIKVYDSVNAEEVWTPPSGHAAAVYAYTDYISEPWFAPAGFNRAHIVVGLDLEMSPSQGDRDLMYGYPNVVNPIVNFFPDGITIWGQKTTQRKPSALDRVNVRRLLLYARKLVATVVRYLVFEPNDEITWKQFEDLCNPIFSNIQSRRGVYEFRVVCDETTNPPEQIDRNEMNGRIYLKPTKAAEVITVDFVITTTGANFDEIEY